MKRFINEFMRGGLVLFALCVVCGQAFAEFDGLPEGVKSNLQAIERYPQASAILLYARESFTLQADGAQVYEWHSFRYLPDEAARDNWGDPRVAYIDGEQTIEILAARTFTRDGRQIEATPHNAYTSVTPDVLDHAPEYNAFRQMVVTMLGLENGSVSEFRYRLTTPKPRFPWLSGRVYFREETPTIVRELTVQTPPTVSLTYRSDHGVEQPIQVNGMTTWRMGEQPGYLAEDLGGHRVLLPNVAFTTAKDWKSVAAEMKTRLGQSVAQLSIPPSLQSSVANATADDAKLDSIQEWVAQRFNRLEFQHPDFDVALRPAIGVLNSGYGNALELAVLVAAFARQSGLHVEPVIWYPFEPAAAGLDHATGLLRVQEGSRVYFRDPLRPRVDFPAVELAESFMLSTDQESADLKPLLPFGDAGNSVGLSLTFADLAADTITGSGTFVATGGYAPLEAVRSLGAKEFLADLLTLPGINIETATARELSSERAEIAFAFSLPKLDTVGDHRLLPACVMPLDPELMSPPLTLEAKEFPFWTRVPGTITVRLSAPVPATWSVDKLPAVLNDKWKGGGGSRTCELRDGRVEVETKISNDGVWLEPAGWSEFRSFLIESGPRPNNLIGFVAKPK